MTNTQNSKLTLKRVDLNIAYACNIKCAGCISLSNFNRTGVVSNVEVEQWLSYWSTGLDIDVITLFGGEPLINPELVDICHTIRKYYPTSTIRLITNGYLLDNVDPVMWFNFEPFEIQVSIHRLDHEPAINKKIKSILEIKSNWKTTTSKETAHQQIVFTNDNFKIYKSKFKDFVAPYGLKDNKLVPLNSTPADAHSVCGSPNTPTLYKGKLYKCPPVANIIDYTGENWNNYLSCDTIEQLPEFISKVGKPEQVCAQCPSVQNMHIYDHFNKDNVYVKQKNIS